VETQNEMEALVQRADKLVNVMAGAVFGALEASAERIELVVRVTQHNQKSEAIDLVLTGLEARREAVQQRLDAAKGTALKASLHRQLEFIAAEENAILAKIGVGEPAQSQAPAKLKRAAGT
jgi:hypothetical protein